jgi:16S rRNA (guanine(966)-N(2))-methyltransferase RsmD
MHQSIRIISGRHKGRKIRGPKNLPVRPTTDFAKEGLFNILHHSGGLSGAVVLDLFSGTGNIAYEFGSRGAAQIDCVDQHRGCIKFIEETAQILELPVNCYQGTVIKFLQQHSGGYDFIFADPPYALSSSELLSLITLVFDKKLLSDQGQFILEHQKAHDFSQHPNWVNSRKFGGSVFSFFE